MTQQGEKDCRLFVNNNSTNLTGDYYGLDSKCIESSMKNNQTY